MAGWLNWREIEKNNDWGIRDKNDATADKWNECAEAWNERMEREMDFSKRQVDMLNLSPEDTVLDICCGPGALTMFIAPKVKKVTALDYSDEMLKLTKKNLDARGIDNVDFLQCNWNFIEPGIHFPKHDIAITRHSPAQGDILKMSLAAKKYCYSLWYCYPHDTSELLKFSKGRWLRSDNEELNSTERPDGRLYGFNVHFNILYDMGANPTVNYVDDTVEYIRDTKEELIKLLADKNLIWDIDSFEETKFFKKNCIELPDHRWKYQRKIKMSVLGWDPNEIIW